MTENPEFSCNKDRQKDGLTHIKSLEFIRDYINTIHAYTPGVDTDARQGLQGPKERTVTLVGL